MTLGRNIETIELLNTATTHKTFQGLEYNYPLVAVNKTTHTKEEKALVKKLKRSIFTDTDIDRKNSIKRRQLRVKLDYHFKNKN